MFFGFGPLYTFLIILGILLVTGIKILKEYERGVIFRLGRMVDPRGPGIVYVTINLKTAKKLGLTIPPTVLYQATKVVK